jgi:single-strand DNA-binding protein
LQTSSPPISTKLSKPGRQCCSKNKKTKKSNYLEEKIMLNRCIFMGRLSKDPELRRTGAGVPVASFSIAVDRDVVSKSDGERKTDFFDIIAWRNTAEFICKHFHKGDMICVECRAEQRSWTDKEGNKRYNIEFNVDNAYFGATKKDGANAPQGGGYAAPAGGGYAAPAGGGYSAPAGNGYAAPAPAGYSAPAAPAPAGYGAPAAPAGYGAPASYGVPAAPAGYGAPAAPAGYSAPVGGYNGPVAPAGYGAPAQDYGVIDENDPKLPF